MKDLVEFIVKQLVTQPDQVSIEEGQDEQGQVLHLSVAPEDMGIVIGKGGQTIKSIRKILAVRAMNDGSRVYLHLVDQNGSAPGESIPSESAE
jgi:predicted RNA-binding protein YlqC (UPF0109 family)